MLWRPSEELDRIGQAEELHLATRRRDGGLSRYVTMWVVRASDAHAVTIRLAKADQHDLPEGNKP